MTVSVDPVPRLGRLTGNWARDMEAVRQWAFDLTRFLRQMRERVGADTDIVADALADGAAALLSAAGAHAAFDVPTPGGAITVTPENPVTFNAATGKFDVAAHSRSDAASDLVAGSTAAVAARGVAYWIYYVDPSDLGGSVAYLATADSGDISPATHRIVCEPQFATRQYYTDRVIS